jgi:hypothetical protein
LSPLLHLFTGRTTELTRVNFDAYHSYQLHPECSPLKHKVYVCGDEIPGKS